MKPVRQIPLKQWLFEQAEREKRCSATVFNRYRAGKYPDVQFIRKNARVIYVQQ